MKFLALVAAAASVLLGQVVQDVRRAAQSGDLQGAEARLQAARGVGGWTPELVLAHSWLGRGAQANRRWDQAMRYSAETRRLSLEMLKGRPLDAEPNLPLALGASIEVNGHSLANTGRRSEGVSFLKEELQRWHGTSMRTRIQKNLHLLTLTGQKAPALETKRFLGKARITSLDSFRGKPVLLFLWAHWCPDCKAQGLLIDSLRQEFPSLAVVAPTQRYGYAAGGEEASPEKETVYIAQVQKEYYPWMENVPMPVSEENFRLYGVSSTPTLVLLDGKGVVRLYHPGQMKTDELRKAVAGLAK
ncbi:MAG TPA: TlpA disulfide reductase family protein [Bryobacteraceae bacterium]|nr:TlpA disulfide reductase family protein [Bryobacteraceae bacterium]